MDLQQEVKTTLETLKQSGVIYLDADGYSTKEYDEEVNDKYSKQYDVLFDELIVNKIYKALGIDTYYSDVAFNFFELVNGYWFGVFYEPYLVFDVEKVLNGDLSELSAIKKYADSVF